MSLFKKKSEEVLFDYNPEIHKAILKCSICNGEQVAGFKDKTTGQFHEIKYITSPADLDWFIEKYGIEVIVKEY